MLDVHDSSRRGEGSHRVTGSVRVDLVVDGMSCASCAARVERELNRLEGVRGTVNFALGTAQVLVPDDLEVVDLVARVERLGYRATLRQDPADALGPQHDEGRRDAERLGGPRLFFTAPAAAVVLVLAMVPPLQFDGWQWLSLVLTTPVALWGALPFHLAALRALRSRTTTMDTLVSLGVLASWTWSVYALLFTSAGDLGTRMSLRPFPGHDADGAGAHLYFEVAAGTTLFLLIGRLAEARARHSAGTALRALLDLGAREVTLWENGAAGRRVPVEQLMPADLFTALPGETIATDAVVLEGSSAIDASLVTGEPVPVDVGPGDPVTGGTLNTSGHLVLRATRVGQDTSLARITRLVLAAQNGKAPVQRLADKVSAVFVPTVLLLALATFITWLTVQGDVAGSFSAAVAVLIVACPCALGLATPTALLVGTGRGAQLGVLLKGPQVLEKAQAIDTILVDKTGTLTHGAMALVDLVPAPGTDTDELLRLAGAIEQGSEHPVGRAVVAHAIDRLGTLPGFDDFTASGGRGVLGTVTVGATTHEIAVGRPEWTIQQAAAGTCPVPDDLQRAVQAFDAQGRTTALVAWDGAVRGVLALADTVREGSPQALTRLRALGLRPFLLTGDTPGAAHAVAREVGLEAEDVFAGLLPEDKADRVSELQRAGHHVAVLGDGVNDAIALARADLGIAMGTGTDVALEAGDLTLIRSDPQAAADALVLARGILRVVRQNLFWAFAYNVAMLPVAALGLLDPVLAGAAMAASSVLVVSNSLRLRRFSPSRPLR